MIVGKKWRWVFGIGCSILALIFASIVTVFIYIGTKSPEAYVVDGNRMRAADMKRLKELDILEADEEILFFYSDAILDIAEGLYLLTDRHLIVYCKRWEPPLDKNSFAQIATVSLARDTSFFNDSFLTVTMHNEDWIELPLSSINDGDVRFSEKLEELVQNAQSALPP